MAVYDISGNVISDASGSVIDIFKSELRDTAWLHQIASDSDGVCQGACTDGTYIYYASINANKLKKYNLQTGEITAVSYTSGLYDHANDMTYNPNTGKIYIATMDNDAHIAIVNPSTLEEESRFSLLGADGNPLPNHGIAYDRINNRYVVANATIIEGTYGQRYTVYDDNFNYVKTIVMPAPETHTIQGIETDGVRIYRALWNSAGHIDYVSVYDFDGNYIKTITVPATVELETLMHDWNGNWYMNFYTGSGGGCRLCMCGLFTSTPIESIESIIS